MKKAILFIFGFLFITGYAGAQVLDNFDTPGSLGIFKDANWGNAASPNITDSIYQAADPTGKSAGVMAVAFDLKGYNQHNAIIPTSQNLDPKGAQLITYWIYIPLNSSIPDSLVFGLWWQVNGNWTWNEYDYYAKDIPKGVWYPLSAAILDSSIADPTNDGFISGHVLGDFGIQWNNGKDSTAVWKGLVYVDNVSLEGAKPTNYATFSSGLQGFGIAWSNGWVDTVAYYNGTIGDSAGVLQWKFINGSADTADNGTAMGIQPSIAYSALTQNFLAFWVYVDATFPDTAYLQTWAQDNNKWNWPGPRGIATYNGNNIPRNVWFPVYFDLSEASVADTVSSSSFNSTKYPLGKFGLQVYGTTTWKGSIYVRDVQFINSFVQSAASWVAADFENQANGAQNFYIPSANSSETLTRVKDTQTSDGTYVLQATVDFPQTTKFVVQRDSIPLLDATNTAAFATQATFGAYFEGTTLGALVDFAIDGPATGNKWVQVESKLDNTALKVNQWNTLSINLDSLVLSGIVNPAKPATIAVQVYYPGDTTAWSGKILFDNLIFTGINQPNELPTPVLNKSSVIKEFKLYNNYPNPFNPSTVIKYDLPDELNVTLKVYDILGREVASLVNNQKQAAGSYSISFNASKYASGVYIYKIIAGSHIKAYKMMLIK
jgi:hypothetical protein